MTMDSVFYTGDPLRAISGKLIATQAQTNTGMALQSIPLFVREQARPILARQWDIWLSFDVSYKSELWKQGMESRNMQSGSI